MFKIHINNFRSYVNQTIDLSRINILIGENSGGKSSFLKFLLAMKQTFENPGVSNLVLSGNYADLGTFGETVYEHDEKKRINFSFSFKNELKDFLHYFLFRDIEDEHREAKLKNYVKKALEYETIVSYSIDKNLDIHSSIITSFHNDYLGTLKIIYNTNKRSDIDYYDIITETPRCTLIYINKTRKKEFIFDEVEFEKKGFLSFIDSSSLSRLCKEKYKSEKIFYELAVFLLNQNLIEFYINSIKYLNPLSSKPERIYFNKDSQNQYKKSDLEKFTNLITNKRIPKKDLTKFGKILKEYGIAEGLEILSPKGLPVSELRVKIKELTSNVSDVGYGVALQIPMLFEAFMDEQQFGSTFLIEQPEVHLHPKLQARFIKTLLSLGDKNSYIIETHSEYLIRMLQVIVKQQLFDITEEDVRIYYFSRGNNKFNITEHKIDIDGRISPKFPPGFFDNSYSLTKELMF